MSSGSYFPPPVMRVDIDKKDGGTRPLGVPTVADRIAQTVVKMTVEPLVEAVFHENSYGYRPNRNAHQAIANWLEKHIPDIWFERYADDALIHCRTKQEAESLLERVRKRFERLWSDTTS